MVEQDHMCLQRVEKLSVLGGATTAGATMQKKHWQAFGMTTLLKINMVSIKHRQKAVVKRLDGRKQCMNGVC